MGRFTKLSEEGDAASAPAAGDVARANAGMGEGGDGKPGDGASHEPAPAAAPAKRGLLGRRQ